MTEQRAADWTPTEKASGEGGSGQMNTIVRDSMACFTCDHAPGRHQMGELSDKRISFGRCLEEGCSCGQYIQTAFTMEMWVYNNCVSVTTADGGGIARLINRARTQDAALRAAEAEVAALRAAVTALFAPTHFQHDLNGNCRICEGLRAVLAQHQQRGSDG